MQPHLLRWAKATLVLVGVGHIITDQAAAHGKLTAAIVLDKCSIDFQDLGPLDCGSERSAGEVGLRELGWCRGEGSDRTWCCSDVDDNGLWYNSRWKTSDWMQAHMKLASRYARQPWVVGSELRNEVRPSAKGTPRWGGGGPNAGDAILTVNPSLLIIVGGLSYGKDLTGVFRLPVRLKHADRVVYSAHSYSWSYPGLPDTYKALHDQLGKDWGFIVQENQWAA
eukprot:Skav228491  [mRNA]  locus=scaffold1092:254966:262095:- [translate_table: standard]